MKRKCFFTLCASVLTAAMMLTACDDPIRNDDDSGSGGQDPEEESILGPFLAEASQKLDAALKAGKIVLSVDTQSVGNGGFAVCFTDGETVSLPYAEKTSSGVTPVVAIDALGYWSVSYNRGVTYERFVSSAGNPMYSDDVGVRVTVDDDGGYEFRFHTPGYPDKVTETVRSSHRINPVSVLQSVVKDTRRDEIILTLADGRVYVFMLDYVRPTGISLLKDKILLTPKGQARFEFVLSPSDARFVPVVTGDGTNLSLAGAGDATPSHYFRIVEAEPAVDDGGKAMAGRYVATVEDLGQSPQYTEEVMVVLTVQDREGQPLRLTDGPLTVMASSEPVLLSIRIGKAEGVLTDDAVFHIKLPYGTNVKSLSPTYETNGANVLVKDAQHDFTAASTVDFSNPVTIRVCSYSGETKDYTVVVHHSSLPVVYVTTPSKISSKEYWTEACGIQIWNAGGDNATYADVQMKGRGNSTWGYPKKPYAIKLDKKAEVLGMPKHKRWVLLANYLDHTCMRNAVAFEIARRLPGLEWTPGGGFVDLVMNGEYQGCYYLCEQIKVDKNRVNITEIDPSDIAGDAVTGGYLFELDSYYDELFKFRTSYRNLPVQFKDPDEDIADEQYKYVKDYFNKIESILYGSDESDVFDYIDLDSFVDWFLVNTLTGNREPQHPKSSYMNKDRGGKLKAGPVWDYDWATFRPTGEGLINTKDMWYDALFRNETFVNRLKERWNAYKADIEGVGQFIDETKAEIRESAEYNLQKWPLNGYYVNEDESLSFDAAVARLKQAFTQKIDLNDKAINAL